MIPGEMFPAGGNLHSDPWQTIYICHEPMDPIDVGRDRVIRGRWQGPGSHALMVRGWKRVDRNRFGLTILGLVNERGIPMECSLGT